MSKLVDATEKVFKKYAGRRVLNALDVACRTRGSTIEPARRGYNVIGVDVHREIVSIAKEKAGEPGIKVRFVVADARGNSAESFSQTLLILLWRLERSSRLDSWRD
ncbi:class I SAM-dependent methyltransferase [Pyrofollis japonicus]|uniref:class I SAM-dependent methyltransferase n=1 Tax=Pyrofollis japonicus TaxID=3060460 RepID=UPI00295B8646|nr:class I SAM-dependent methyltransferase [Pyrofollis japonicus]